MWRSGTEKALPRRHGKEVDTARRMGPIGKVKAAANEPLNSGTRGVPSRGLIRLLPLIIRQQGIC